MDYEKFLNRKFKRHTKRGNRRDIRKYLLHVHRHHKHADIPDFTVGGGKVKKRGKRESDDYFARWQLIDYSVYGGNCVKETSSVFVHCRTVLDIFCNKMTSGNDFRVNNEQSKQRTVRHRGASGPDSTKTTVIVVSKFNLRATVKMKGIRESLIFYQKHD